MKRQESNLHITEIHNQKYIYCSKKVSQTQLLLLVLWSTGFGFTSVYHLSYKDINVVLKSMYKYTVIFQYAEQGSNFKFQATWPMMFIAYWINKITEIFPFVKNEVLTLIFQYLTKEKPYFENNCKHLILIRQVSINQWPWEGIKSSKFSLLWICSSRVYCTHAFSLIL